MGVSLASALVKAPEILTVKERILTRGLRPGKARWHGGRVVPGRPLGLSPRGGSDPPAPRRSRPAGSSRIIPRRAAGPLSAVVRLDHRQHHVRDRGRRWLRGG